MTDLTKLKKLLEGHTAYQDIEIDGQVFVKGMRECKSRWNIIRPHIKRNTVIMDVGSDLGYFTSKIAETFRDSLVISLERSEKGAQIQKEILKLKKLSNVVLCNHAIDTPTLECLNNTVEGIDTFLVPSVFHHYPLEKTKEFLSCISKFCPELIIEIPHVWNAPDVTGVQYTNFDKELKNYYRNVEFIGESQLGAGQSRKFYKAWNTHLTREALTPTFDFGLDEKMKHRVHKLAYDNGKWMHSKMSVTGGPYDVNTDWIPGFSPWTLLHWNLIYPDPEWWQKNALAAYQKLIDKKLPVGDVRVQNLLVTHQGIVAIDWAHNDPPETAKRHLEIVRRVFQDMDFNTFNKLFTLKK